MKQWKPLLFFGMANIWTGVLLRIFSVHVPSPYLFFVIGGSVKLVYLTIAYRKGIYKPGIELAFLGVGFFLLFLGILVRLQNPDSIFGVMLIAKAVLMKLTFLFLVIRKLRAARLQAFMMPVNDREAD